MATDFVFDGANARVEVRDTVSTALRQAEAIIIEAENEPRVAERYLIAHRAAQQVAAVVLATHPVGRLHGRSRLLDTWSVLAAVAPECAEWATYFAATQPKRQAVAAGVRAIVSEREADDLVRDARNFRDHVIRQLSLASRRRPHLERAG